DAHASVASHARNPDRIAHRTTRLKPPSAHPRTPKWYSPYAINPIRASDRRIEADAWSRSSIRDDWASAKGMGESHGRRRPHERTGFRPPEDSRAWRLQRLATRMPPRRRR